MGDSYLETSNLMRNIFRWFFAFLDRPAYWLLGLVYELFFNVASADLFSNATVMKFYGRVQLILGVFMMFQLAMTILRGIVNPDSFTDSKSGAGNLITRIITALVLLTLLMPINVSPRNEYEAQIHNNGVLFGTLYSLQHRLLANNTLGRLVLGTDDGEVDYMSSTSKNDELKKSARIFTSTILKGFYRINLLPENERTKHEDGKDDSIFNANRVCQNIDDATLAKYTRVDAEPGDIISMVNETCETDFNLLNHIPGVNLFAGSEMYMIAYMPFISMLVAYVFVFILLSFTVDVAVRAVKLAVLRLIAPIPIISYMDPKGSKDSAFNSWVKTLTSTYIDLFVRLASVYFVIYLIQDIIKNGLYINNSGGIIGSLSFIIICIGLFVFAKQAPKFIKDVLGLKGEPGKLFGGIQEALAVGSVGVGAVGGAISRGVAARQSGENIGHTILSGIAGGIGGGYNAGKTLWNSKDFDSKAVMNQVRAYNAKNYSNAADDSTFGGRMVAAAQANFGLKNDLQTMDDKIKYFGAANSAVDRINKAFDNNGDYSVTADDAFMNDLRAKGAAKGYTYQFDATTGDLTDNAGNVVLKKGQSYTLKEFNDRISRFSSSSDGVMKDALDEAKKQAQGIRFDEIRALDRAEVERRVNSTDPIYKEWTQNDLVAWEAAHTIYEVSQKYSDEVFFKDFKGKDFAHSPGWGKYKFGATNAGRTADQIKSSNAYSTAKANAQRAAESQKK